MLINGSRVKLLTSTEEIKFLSKAKSRVLKPEKFALNKNEGTKYTKFKLKIVGFISLIKKPSKELHNPLKPKY